jgi:Outer membrane protein
MVVKQYEAGVTANLELLNVNSQMNQIRFQHTSAKGDVEVAELILKQAMNISREERIDIDIPADFKKITIDYEQILSDAMVRRPEMQISAMMIQYYIFEKKIARSKAWPKIDFIGSFGLAKEEYISKDAGVDPATGTAATDQKMEQQWYGGVKCSIPLWGSTGEYSYQKEQWAPVVSSYQGTSTITNSYKFNFLDNLAQYSDRASSDVDYEKARQDMIKTKQDVTLEVKEACFNYEKSLLQLDTAINKVKYQEGDLELTKFKRQMEEAQDSNVIDSMIKLAQERFGRIQAARDCQIAIATISQAVGVPDYFEDAIIANDKAVNTK